MVALSEKEVKSGYAGSGHFLTWLDIITWLDPNLVVTVLLMDAGRLPTYIQNEIMYDKMINIIEIHMLHTVWLQIFVKQYFHEFR